MSIERRMTHAELEEEADKHGFSLIDHIAVGQLLACFKGTSNASLFQAEMDRIEKVRKANAESTG